MKVIGAYQTSVTLVAWTCFIVGGLLAGCGGDPPSQRKPAAKAPGVERKTPDRTPRANDTAQPKLATPAPTAEPPKVEGKQVVLNPSFQSWEIDGAPLSWPVLQGKVSQALEANGRQEALQLEIDDEGKGGVLRQFLKVKGPIAGKNVEFSADMKSSFPGNLRVFLRYGDAKEDAFVLEHNGDGEWTTESLNETLPANAMYNKFKVVIVQNMRAEEPAWVDNVKVIMEE